MSQHPNRTSGEGFPVLTDAVTGGSGPLFVENLLRGEKPRADWMCGAELELFGYDRARGFERIDAGQVQSVLAGFAREHTWLDPAGRFSSNLLVAEEP